MLSIYLNNFISIIVLIVARYTYSLVIYFISRYLLSKFNRYEIIIYIFGSIGIIIHELSHLIVAIIFRHKLEHVQILDLSNDGFNGFVETSYNTKSYYQRIGNFFITTAPIIITSSILLLFVYMWYPQIYQNFKYEISLNIINNLISYSSMTAKNILFAVLFISIIPFSSLSKKDIINSFKSLHLIIFMSGIIVSIYTVFLF